MNLSTPTESQHREMLASQKSGGIIFTTIQKFSLEGAEDDHPVLCERTNVVVISDEAHFSQYGTKGRLDTRTGKYVYGYAKHMRDALPGASFIGFTGTPIEKAGTELLVFSVQFSGEEEKPLGEAGHQPRGDRPAEQRRGGGDRGRGGCFHEGKHQGQVGGVGG